MKHFTKWQHSVIRNYIFKSANIFFPKYACCLHPPKPVFKDPVGPSAPLCLPLTRAKFQDFVTFKLWLQLHLYSSKSIAQDHRVDGFQIDDEYLVLLQVSPNLSVWGCSVGILLLKLPEKLFQVGLFGCVGDNVRELFLHSKSWILLTNQRPNVGWFKIVNMYSGSKSISLRKLGLSDACLVTLVVSDHSVLG